MARRSTTGLGLCDKEALNAELHAAMQGADKKARKALTQEFEARRKDLEAQVTAAATASLQPLFRSFFALHNALRLLLAETEALCQAARSTMAALPMPERAAAFRIFYDGTSDDVYSNPSALPLLHRRARLFERRAILPCGKGDALRGFAHRDMDDADHGWAQTALARS